VITRSEWRTEAWKEAAKVRGRQRAKWYGFLMDAPIYAGLAAAGVLGYGAWWVWQHTAAALHGAAPHVQTGPDGPAVPVWTWVAAVVLLALTVFAFRPGRIDLLSVLIVKFLVFGAAWLFLAGFAVQAALG
jgi:hypothetical protein